MYLRQREAEKSNLYLERTRENHQQIFIIKIQKVEEDFQCYQLFKPISPTTKIMIIANETFFNSSEDTLLENITGT